MGFARLPPSCKANRYCLRITIDEALYGLAQMAPEWFEVIYT